MNGKTKAPASAKQQPHRQRPGTRPSRETGGSNATPTAASSEGPDDNACVVCFKTVDIYSIGDCDHPVCYECSTRMRVLCQQNECPICRHVLAKVLFTLEKLPYRELEAGNRSDFYSKKYRIGFCSADIQQKFFQLLDHPCQKCAVPPYRTFSGLRNHVRNEHNLYYCDLCVETLKIFTFERRCYTQTELHIHNTKGDADNRSHRGHPMCEYCKSRYVDRDELFRHLRREHYFCHFCDADGCNEFYNKYSDLADHFRSEHFLCEEGKCATEQFVGAFRNEIEYKAHVANIHGKSLNKMQAKQTRTLQLEITLGRRGRSGPMEQGIANMRSRNDEHFDDLPSTSTHHGPVNIDAGNEEEFPTLGGVTAAPNVSLVRPPPPSMRNLSGTSGLARTKENFPALGGATNIVSAVRVDQFQQKPVSAVFKKSNASSSAQGGGGNANAMLLHVSNRPAAKKTGAATEMDFPALPAGSKSKKKGYSARNLEEDMLPSGSSPFTTNVSAKHRTLVDDYVSVANPSTYQKIQMVQKEESEAKARQEAMKKSAPKLTAAEFPTLGPTSSSKAVPLVSVAKSSQNNWAKPINEKRQRELENRKAKVAPAPVLPTSTGKMNNNNYQIQQPGKNTKEKKTKEKKKNTNNNEEIVTKPKQKEKNNNEQNQSNETPNLIKANGHSTIRTPPGLGATASAVKPPPGFLSNVSVNSVAKLQNDLTFTSSLGESYSIVPSPYTYSDPPESDSRNQVLVTQIMKILKTPENLENFRLLSLKFRDGSCTGQAYYEHCQSALLDSFSNLFPELLVMLPDISKQQELYLVHKQQLNSLSVSQRKSLTCLEVCGVCKQIVLPKDLESHQEVHELSKNFPSLSAGGSFSNIQHE
ncbi:LOW QUALITY PROTEIN: E3 ubiquitin-protein ligase ZNF598 [Drosophila tropicalis]|uniref:LOW QUALITY PROTEIN: E3 ubiquitin-protein ligase ZNF598 n=1 Tax=Drosophila tropicalis TaxID=46794 RepID=UPI0035AB9069